MFLYFFPPCYSVVKNLDIEGTGKEFGNFISQSPLDNMNYCSYGYSTGRKGAQRMNERIDRSKIKIAKQEEFDKIDNQYCIEATVKEKLETITYLRECFYGEEATTGRVQRVYTMFKRV